MKNRHVIGMVALSLCLGATVVQAQYYSYLPPDEGPVFRLGVGPSFFQNGRLTQFGGTPASTVHFQTGVAAEAAVGWAFNKYTAVDFETGYIGAKINSVPGYISDNSRLYSVPFLVNFTLSYPIPRTILVPYIGVGGGGADMVFDTDYFSDNSSPPNNIVGGSENDVVFAGQAFAGLRFNVTRNISFDVGYKFFATSDPTFTYPDGFNVGFRGVRTHSVMFAFKFDF